jgi:hypothetical protein
LKFLPDTAHLHIAGEDPAEAIRRARGRLAGIHLKEWTGDFGRSYHRYARGFVELGRGEVDLEACVKAIRETQYDGWLIIEQDSVGVDMVDSLQKSADWLRDHALLPPRRIRRAATRATGEERPEPASTRARPAVGGDSSARKEAAFMRDILGAAHLDAESFYGRVAASVRILCDCDLVTLWSYNPAYNFMTLLASASEQPCAIQPTTMSWDTSICREAAENTTVTSFDLTDEATIQPSVHRKRIEELGLRRMISVPILNSWNPHHARYVLNLCAKDPSFPYDAKFLEQVAKDVGRAADAMLDSWCTVAAKRAAGACVEAEHEPERVLKSMIEVCRDLVPCEGLSLFVANSREDRLEPGASTGLEWNAVPQEGRYYRRKEGLTGRVWHFQIVKMMVDARQDPENCHKSWETVATKDLDRCLMMPMRDARGDVVGVIRCTNRTPLDGRMFTDDDVAILDAVGSVIASHLRVLHSSNRYRESVARVVHELGTPVAAMRAVVESMKDGFTERGEDPDTYFGVDYLGDAESWAELMKRILINSGFTSTGKRLSHPILKPTFLLNGVVAAAVRQIRWLLYERDLAPGAIWIGDFSEVPRLWIDRNQFQQIFFNLLSNAIKYSSKDPSKFRVEIGGADSGDGFIVWCRDWGVGIDEGTEEHVFEEGVRGKHADAYAEGQGIGLSVVRRILNLHDARVRVTRNRNPTELTIFLPRRLARGRAK